MDKELIVALLLEDEPIIAIDIEQELARAGFAVETVLSCKDAKHWLAAKKPDVAIVDIMLRDGIPDDVVRQLSADKIPFIVHSGEHPSMHENTPFELGVWVNMPAAPQDIVQVARGLIGS